MRATVVVFAMALSMAGPAAAQNWVEYQNNQDGFKVNFPGQPKVSQITWTSEQGYTLPGRVYSAERGRERYSMTVVDYAPIEQQGAARRAACPQGAEPCIGSDLSGPGYWKHDVRGALIFATYKFIQRDAKLTGYQWNHEDLVEGHQIELLNNADQSRTFAYVAMRENKLYVMEGTVPKGYPPPALFQNSLGWVDKDGSGIRYQTIYSNEIYGLGDRPAPEHGGGGAGRGGAGGGGQGGGRGGGRRGGGAGNPQPQQP